MNEDIFKYAIQSLSDDPSRVKWESAKVITNTAPLFTKLLSKAVGNILVNTQHEGNVVRWSAAHAVSKIMLCNTPINKELVPAVEVIVKRETDNAYHQDISSMPQES